MPLPLRRKVPFFHRISASLASAEPPKGEVTKYTFEKSQIFPGTIRDYWVYVPQQYDPARPACVYVNQDGVQYNAPAVFDELIEKKEIPVAPVGQVFISTCADLGQVENLSHERAS